MLKLFSLGTSLLRYWRMVHDPRTPPVVKGLVYTGIAVGLWPKGARPRWMKNQGLMEDSALAPGLISLGMLMVPKEIRDEYDAEEDAATEHPLPSMIGQWTATPEP
jgi:hypothetical protein